MAKFVIYRDSQSRFRWRLKAENGQIVADSGEGYSSKDNCQYGVSFVKQQAPWASLEDLT